MILRLLRFVRGFLVLKLRGRNCERFLNLCANRGIATGQLSVGETGEVLVCIYLSDFYRLRPLLRKTKVKLRIEKRAGLPFLVQRYRKRVVFVSILAVMMVCVAFLSTRIWRIEVLGNSSLGDETILEYLKQEGITYGIGRDAIDNDGLELALRQDFEQVIWASVYEKGTKLVVRIQEKLASQKETLVSQNPCTDLVAKRDATIYSIVTRSGTPLVKAEDTVKAGDILVCGRQEIIDDNGEISEYYYQSADADILGISTISYEDEIPLKRVETKASGAYHDRYFFRFLDYRVTTPKLYAAFDCSETIEETNQLCLPGSFYLPVYVGRIREKEQLQCVENVSMEQAKKDALSHFSRFLTNLEENGVRIIDKNVMIEKEKENYHIYGRLKICEDITQRVPTEVLEAPAPKENKEE